MNNFWTNLAVFLLSGVFLGVSIYSFRHDQLFNGVLSIISLIIIVIVAWRGNNLFRDKPIPKNIVISKYIELMEESYKISINPNSVLWRDDEVGDHYVIVLKDVEDDGSIRYFPFECNKYRLEFGRGTGMMKFRVSEVYNWLLKNSKIDLKPLIYADLQEKSRLRNINEMQPQGGQMIERYEE